MWWLAILAGAYVIKKILEDENDAPQKSILDRNLETLATKIKSESVNSKKIAVLGQPGAGKSSMILNITNGECIPKPIIGQQTDATNWSVGFVTDFFTTYSYYKFVDTPGYGTYSHPVESFLKYFPFNDFDVFFLLLKGKIYSSDEKVFNHINEIVIKYTDKKLVIVRSFADDLSYQERKEIEYDYNQLLKYTKNNIQLIFLSNRNKYGIDEIKSILSIR
ncbi:MAG: GTPase domain-containing protein [Bacteroidales bacterium]